MVFAAAAAADVYELKLNEQILFSAHLAMIISFSLSHNDNNAHLQKRECRPVLEIRANKLTPLELMDSNGFTYTDLSAHTCALTN